VSALTRNRQWICHFIEKTGKSPGHYQVIKCLRTNTTMFDYSSKFIQKLLLLPPIQLDDDVLDAEKKFFDVVDLSE
jgi:hypothetical protein